MCFGLLVVALPFDVLDLSVSVHYLHLDVPTDGV